MGVGAISVRAGTTMYGFVGFVGCWGNGKRGVVRVSVFPPLPFVGSVGYYRV